MPKFRLFACLVGLFALSSVSLANELAQLAKQIDAGALTQVEGRLNQLLQTKPENYQVQFLKARLLAKQGNQLEAIQLYRKLIKMTPQQPEAYNNLARLLVAQGDIEQAQSLLEQAMKTHASYFAVYENLSAIYVEMARESYGKALQINGMSKSVALRELPNVPADGLLQLASSENIQEKQPVTSQSVSQPAVKQVNSSVDQDAIITTLQGWAAAWSEQAAEVYLVFYTDDFHPPGMSRQRWEYERRIRLKRPEWIQVGLSQFEIQPLANGDAKVELIQEYRASNYQDKTRKQFQMRQTMDGWRIVDERSIAKLN